MCSSSVDRKCVLSCLVLLLLLLLPLVEGVQCLARAPWLVELSSRRPPLLFPRGSRGPGGGFPGASRSRAEPRAFPEGVAAI
eukprot:3615416-Pyramimonas_sp.AAC.1